MKRAIFTSVVSFFFLAFALTASNSVLRTGLAQEEKEPHGKYFRENYEGTKTCLECRKGEAESFFHSQHYQWKGDAPMISNSKGRKTRETKYL